MARNDPLLQAHALAVAVTEAQRRATAEGRSFCVARPPRGERPIVEPLAGLPRSAGGLIEQFVAEGRVLLVTPQGITTPEGAS